MTMTDHSIIGLCYVLITVLLLICLKASNIATHFKIGLIVLMSSFYIVTWEQVRNLKGWSTFSPLPESFRVIWIHIREDNKSTGEAGKIYYWIRALDEVGLPSRPPRVHHIPWNLEAAELAETAKARLEAGEVLNGRLSNNALIRQEAQSEQSMNDKDPLRAGEDQKQPQFEFITVAPLSLPTKIIPIQ